MKQFLAPEIWPLIVIAIVWWLLSLGPIFYSAFVAFRTRPALPRRLLFIATVSALCYGLLILFLFVFSIPLAAFRNYIAPGLEHVGELPLVGRWLAEISDVISRWGWFVVPLILAGTALWLVRYLAPRWPQLVLVLGPNNSFKPNPLRGSA